MSVSVLLCVIVFLYFVVFDCVLLCLIVFIVFDCVVWPQTSPELEMSGTQNHGLRTSRARVRNECCVDLFSFLYIYIYIYIYI